MYNTGTCGQGKSDSHSQHFSHKPCLLSEMFCISTSSGFSPVSHVALVLVQVAWTSTRKIAVPYAVRAVTVAKRREYAEFLGNFTILWLWRLVCAATNSSLQFVLGERVLLASEERPEKAAGTREPCWDLHLLLDSLGDCHTNFRSEISSFALEAIQTSKKRGPPGKLC